MGASLSGHSCARRRARVPGTAASFGQRVHPPPPPAEPPPAVNIRLHFDSGWEVIPEPGIAGRDLPQISPAAFRGATVATRPALLRFRRAVRKIIAQLLLRQIWSRVGGFLNTTTGRRSRKHATLSALWRDYTPLIQRIAPLYKHLRRQNGRLVYRARRS